MKKTADVIEVMDNNTAKIMLYRHKKCTGCGSCNKAMHPGSIITATNSAAAKANDKVTVIVKKKINFLEILVMYILPTAMFMAGLWIGGKLITMGAPDFSGVAMALIFLIIAIVVYFKTKHRFKPRFSSTIVKVITT